MARFRPSSYSRTFLTTYQTPGSYGYDLGYGDFAIYNGPGDPDEDAPPDVGKPASPDKKDGFSSDQKMELIGVGLDLVKGVGGKVGGLFGRKKREKAAKEQAQRDIESGRVQASLAAAAAKQEAARQKARSQIITTGVLAGTVLLVGIVGSIVYLKKK